MAAGSSLGPALVRLAPLNLLMDLFMAPLAFFWLPAIAVVTTLLRSATSLFAWFLQHAPLLPAPRALSSRDKVVIITGASSGIGRCMALEYAKRGACLALAARRVELLKEAAEECKRLGSPGVWVQRCDVSKPEDCQALIRSTIQYFGRIDVLVNNAGTAHSGLVEEYKSEEEFSSTVTVDFWGNVWPTLEALPHLQRTRGQVFVTASAAAFLTYPRQAFYNAAKAAVVQFFDTLRVEEGPRGIAVTIAMPGFVKSELTTRASASSHIPWFWPMLSTPQAAYQMVDAAERRDHYLIVPLWYATWLPYRLFAPELMDWFQRVVLLGRAPSSAVHDLLAAAVGDSAVDNLFSHMSALSLSPPKRL